jgi:hypothetical protein
MSETNRDLIALEILRRADEVEQLRCEIQDLTDFILDARDAVTSADQKRELGHHIAFLSATLRRADAAESELRLHDAMADLRRASAYFVGIRRIMLDAEREGRR